MLVNGYARANKTPMPHRFATLDEVKALEYGQRVPFLGDDGQVRAVKVNGKPKRWKRDIDRVEVSVKYGMTEYARFATAEALKRFVVAL